MPFLLFQKIIFPNMLPLHHRQHREKLVAPMPERDAPSPRLAGAFPRVISAAINKPYGPPQPMMMGARARAQEAALNTQCQSIRNQNCETDFQAAMNIMEHNIMSETAHAISDEESGKMLKYRQLITHPKYQDAWTHSSANKFG